MVLFGVGCRSCASTPVFSRMKLRAVHRIERDRLQPTVPHSSRRSDPSPPRAAAAGPRAPSRLGPAASRPPSNGLRSARAAEAGGRACAPPRRAPLSRPPASQDRAPGSSAPTGRPRGSAGRRRPRGDGAGPSRRPGGRCRRTRRARPTDGAGASSRDARRCPRSPEPPGILVARKASAVTGPTPETEVGCRQGFERRTIVRIRLSGAASCASSAPSRAEMQA